ncbi:MAG: hypothetical protein CLLPBCKN_006468 [Chroococcidiopsis cubana SAG 39.79]|nr:hypothetical protein [Chroococcidiopsis cubana]MDZ4877033.1 hypothetical protein [Chroococcidiopsis cubana SAG 39.79]
MAKPLAVKGFGHLSPPEDEQPRHQRGRPTAQRQRSQRGTAEDRTAQDT